MYFHISKEQDIQWIKLSPGHMNRAERTSAEVTPLISLRHLQGSLVCNRCFIDWHKHLDIDLTSPTDEQQFQLADLG